MQNTCPLLVSMYAAAEQHFIDFVLLTCEQYVFFPLSAGKIPFIHVGNQVVSELGPIVQFTKAKVCLLIVSRLYIAFSYKKKKKKSNSNKQCLFNKVFYDLKV